MVLQWARLLYYCQKKGVSPSECIQKQSARIKKLVILLKHQTQSHMRTQLSCHTLEQLYIEADQFRNYKSLPPLISPSTIKIRIYSNDFDSIDQLAKQQYPHLKIIAIIHNQLSYVPRLKTCQLNMLWLSNNRIVDITAFAEGFYPKLTTLYLNDNLITVMPKINAPSLFSIYLNFNLIQSLDEFFDGSSHHLHQIQAQNNQLTKIPNIKAPNMFLMYFRNNLIEDIHECFHQQHFPYLVTIDLTSNKLKNIDSLKVPTLKKIKLSSNLIQSNFSLSQFHFILTSQLHISGNLIKTLPKLNMPMLEQIYADQNQFESIEDFSLGEYPELSRVQLQGNKIKSLPRLKAANIKRIDCRGNMIDDVDRFFSERYDKLESVDLSQNSLTRLPKLSSLNIKELRLQFNPLTSIDKQFFATSYQQLTKLSVSFLKDPIVKCLQSNLIEMITRTFSMSCKFDFCFEIDRYHEMDELVRIAYRNKLIRWKILEFEDKIKFAYFVRDRHKEVEKKEKIQLIKKIRSGHIKMGTLIGVMLVLIMIAIKCLQKWYENP